MSDAPVAWVDGEPVQDPLLLDRGLHYGDGLFETMIVRNGRIRFADLHRARLQQGCARLQIAQDADAAMDEAATQAADIAACVLKLIVTRGSATARGYGPAGDETPRRVLLRYADPRATAAAPPPAASAVTLAAVLGENPRLAGLKHLNRLEQVLARQELRARGAFEGLLCSSSGLLISGTMSNLFIVRGNELLTPRVDRCGIAGVMRAVVIREARRAGIPVHEMDLPHNGNAALDEAFVTNVRLGVQPLEQLDGRSLRVGPMSRQLQQRVAALDA